VIYLANGTPTTAEPSNETIEVCRSFSYKLNLANHGGPAYEAMDFFASRKMSCARDSADFVSQQIFEECVAEVRAAVDAAIVKMRAKRGLKSEVA
jgi:hypothetical protein